MNWQAFENNMRESAETHETPVDHEMLWQKIRQKKRRRRGILIWWLSGTVTTGSLVLYLLVQKPSAPENHRVQATPIAAFAQPSATTQNPNPDVKASTATSPDKIPNGQLPDVKIQQAPATKNNSLTTNQTLTATTGAKEIHTSTPSMVSMQLAPGVQSGSSNSNNSLFQNSTQSIEEQGLSNEVNPAHIEGLSEIPPADQMWLYPSVSPVRIPAEFSPAEVTGTDREMVVPKKHRRNIYAGLEAGYAVWDINRSRSDSNLLSRSGERELEAISMALQGNFKIAGRFSIRAGVQYSRFTSVFKWQDSWEAEAKPLITDTYLDGTVDSFYYWSPSLHLFERTVKNYNHIHTVNIPLDFQYNFSMGKWTVAPFAGIQAGYAFAANGVIAGNDSKPVKNVYAGIYRNALTFSGRGGIYCAYRLNEKLNLSIAPTAVFDLTGRVKSTAFPEEKFRQLGLNVGLVRRFGF